MFFRNFKFNKVGQTSITLLTNNNLTSNTRISYSKVFYSTTIKMSKENLFVSPKWLNDNFERVKILDASWFMPAEKRDSRGEFQQKHIKNSKFFDIDEICDKTVKLPHNLPSVEFFEKEMQRLGIKNDDHVVIYDTRAQYVASARVWWTFLVFGHDQSKVSLLEGGLPNWEKSGYSVESGPIVNNQDASIQYKATYNGQLVRSKEEMLDNIQSKKFQVLDARPGDRFWGRIDEPRPGLRRGHIPNSLNIPWVDLLSKDGGYHTKEQLEKLFSDKGVNLNEPISTTCGSGTTAAVISLSLFKLGYPIPPIYDGSWSEYGQPSLKLPASCSNDQ
ncbi:hypothetical protein DLAC_10605 [Tieghemostelium lacteum]|uniref:Rhodanese domain-containing protein n=1 Tax=Tieghemostelium lacteum TaxID=361077 RepID=A0A151Z4E1_TIELA|nr:hypothetical protein DLAC_10605 [Tieghemostelium lacteum]|eukprot:KYQ88808.1 hypothetical protein DLAC_10605 [Tieghemostelium lacteum]